MAQTSEPGQAGRDICSEPGCHAVAVITCFGCVEEGLSGRLCADHWNAHVFGPLDESAEESDDGTDE